MITVDEHIALLHEAERRFGPGFVTTRVENDRLQMTRGGKPLGYVDLNTKETFWEENHNGNH